MRDVQHGDGEAGKLTHGEVLPEPASKYRTEELFERLSYAVDIGSCKRYFLKGANHIRHLRVWKINPSFCRKDRRVRLASLSKKGSVRGSLRLQSSHLSLFGSGADSRSGLFARRSPWRKEVCSTRQMP